MSQIDPAIASIEAFRIFVILSSLKEKCKTKCYRLLIYSLYCLGLSSSFIGLKCNFFYLCYKYFSLQKTKISVLEPSIVTIASFSSLSQAYIFAMFSRLLYKCAAHSLARCYEMTSQSGMTTDIGEPLWDGFERYGCKRQRHKDFNDFLNELISDDVHLSVFCVIKKKKY